MTIHIALAALLSLAGFAHAQTSSFKPERNSSLKLESENFKPYLGASFGYMDENRGLRTEGTPWNLKLIGSFYHRSDWVMDAGLGVLGQHFSNADDKTALAGTLEASSRYQFKGNWQLGPHLKTYTGVGDLYGSSTNLLTSFVGIQGLREFTAFSKYQSRVGLSVVTDIGIPNQVAYVTSLELQVSLASLFNQTKQHYSPVRRETVPPVAVTKAQGRREKSEKPLTSVYFELGEINLSEQVKLDIKTSIEQLRASGEIQSDSVVRVTGYADQVGDRGLNLKVSRSRARAVRNELINSGLRADQIQVLWKGKAEAAPEPRSEDRRVELRRVQ